MNKTKRNMLIILIALLLLASIVIFLNFQKETVEFEDFSVEVPLGSSFGKVRENDTMINGMYRCYGEDLTITSFNKTYVEEEYYKNSGETIDFAKSMMKHMGEDDNNKMNEISPNLTRIIDKSIINGQEDTDVACIYHDDDHLIIIEGGDEDFITEIAESIQIL